MGNQDAAYNFGALVGMIAAFALIWATFAYFAGKVARKKNRDFNTYFVIGLFFGPIALLIALLVSPGEAARVPLTQGQPGQQVGGKKPQPPPLPKRKQQSQQLSTTQPYGTGSRASISPGMDPATYPGPQGPQAATMPSFPCPVCGHQVSSPQAHCQRCGTALIWPERST